MSNVARFTAYAAAFEEAYASDDWKVLEPFFDEDAVYEPGSEMFLGGHFEGRSAILGYFKAVLDGFDRCFETRKLEILEGPSNAAGTVRILGSATYRKQGFPELVLVLEEFVTFAGEEIVRLEDRYEPAMLEELVAYAATHGAALGFSLA